MKKTLHKAGTRVVNDLGWLRIHASFRDNNPTDDTRQFGTLCIVDDAMMIPGGRGFTLHPHDNMEIVSWVLSGIDEHNDSKHGINLIAPGGVQLMSAGTGIEHAENNPSEVEPVHMFQIWVKPKVLNIVPRYQTLSLRDFDRVNKLVTFITPDGSNGSLEINQDAYFSITTLDNGESIPYAVRKKGNGLYIMVLFGKATVGGEELTHRDAIGITSTEAIEIKAIQKTEVLIIEMPV